MNFPLPELTEQPGCRVAAAKKSPRAKTGRMLACLALGCAACIGAMNAGAQSRSVAGTAGAASAADASGAAGAASAAGASGAAGFASATAAGSQATGATSATGTTDVTGAANSAPDTSGTSGTSGTTGSGATAGTALRTRRSGSLDTEGEFADFSQWQGVSTFIDELVARDGFDRAELEGLLRQTRYVDSAIQLMKPAPPGRPKNWQAYRARFVEPVRINAGAAFWNANAGALARAEARYGVPAEIIVGIIGVETVYGRNTGSFRVMDAITTLAFAYPNTPNREARMAYFRGELENTLLFARESKIDPFSLYGSYAGAIGLPQFMPGSIRQFAIDFDGDGRIDLRGSAVDAIGSVANFLVQHGWKAGEPIAFPASVRSAAQPMNVPASSGEIAGQDPTIARSASAPGRRADGSDAPAGINVTGTGNTNTDPASSASIDNTPPDWQKFINQGLEAKFTVDELKAAGVVPAVEPPAGMRFGLVDLQNGAAPTEYWLGANNFFAITQYNRSYFYAMSVVDLGRAVRVAREQGQ